MTRTDEHKIKLSLNMMKDGTVMGAPYGKPSTLIAHFGCMSCSWKDTPLCPHGFTGVQTHHNRICSQRALYIKDMFSMVGSKTKVAQVEEGVRLKLLLDKLTHDFTQNGVLDPNIAKFSKNIISLLDKMRRQDEGIKLQADVSLEVKEFKDIVETHAKVVEGKDIVKEAELIDNKQDNQGGREVPGKKV